MATVIDSLLIELGLDASKFDQAQKKSIEQLRKFDEANQKSNKAANKGTKELADNLGKARDALAALGTIALAIDGFKNFAINVAQGNAALGRQADLLGTNFKQLDAFGAAAKKFGGDNDSIIGGVATIEKGLAEFKLGRGGVDIVTELTKLGLQAKNGSVDLFELSDALKKLQGGVGTQGALSVAKSLGFDDAGYQLLVQGSEAVKEATDAMAEQARANDELKKKSQALQNSWVDFENSLKGVSNEVFSNTSPAFTEMIKDATGLTKQFAEFDDKAKSGLSTLLMFSASLMTIAGALKVVHKVWPGAAGGEGGVTGAVGSGAASLMGRLSLGLGLALHSEDLNKGEDDWLAANKAKSGANAGGQPGSTASQRNRVINYMMSQGWTREQAVGIAANIQTESGYSASATGDHGAAYGIGQWHKGRQDMFAKVFGKSIQSSTFEEQLSFYNWELKNTHALAGHALKNATTAGDAAAIVSSKFEAPADANGEMLRRSQLASQMIGAQAAVTGGSGGSSSVQTNINAININTQATDANGIARDMHASLANNALINSGINAAQ